jgi:hypothetical protein
MLKWNLLCRERRGLPVFHTQRRTARPRLLAGVVAADVEQAQVEPADTAAGSPVPLEGENQGRTQTRRLTSGGRHRQKKPQKYQLSDLVPGQEVEGTVVSCCTEPCRSLRVCDLSWLKSTSCKFAWSLQVHVTTYGAFADIGAGRDALIHISQLAVCFATLLHQWAMCLQTSLLCIDGI